MDDSEQYGRLATRLAGLQQRVEVVSRQSLVVSQKDSGARDGGALTTHDSRLTTLIGASKSQPAELLEAAIRLGLRDFGENKVQEAQAKWPVLKARYRVRLHLIGPLQSNKAREAVALFDVIQTVDRVKIAEALAEACEKEGKRPDFMIQVNIGEEPQKAGVAPGEVERLLRHCEGLGLPVIGLMAVPPADMNPAPYFALLKKMADGLGLPELSMGMSGDFEIATRLGATMVRVGTALFGERERMEELKN